ncbi:MAG: hypothetical protein RBR41_00210 [Desulfovibrio sp.]|uniref:hypothetical protein n=1 Tax=Desulfovibrio sp. TaxID=885 RepID=UPI002A3631BF|nr:hypothetical protein [Desulfovibrio sp.]MDY0258079.1 hypothetical protein [Desulfovibrio sp.]
MTLERLTLEKPVYGRQKPAYAHFVARIFLKILAEQLPHFIRNLLQVLFLNKGFCAKGKEKGFFTKEMSSYGTWLK